MAKNLRGLTQQYQRVGFFWAGFLRTRAFDPVAIIVFIMFRWF
jgi:hypothetical protein